MKILMYIMYWYPYEGALQPIYGRVFSRMREEGNEVTIITSLPHYRLGRKERYPEYRRKWRLVDYERGIKIVRCWVFAPYFENQKLRAIVRLLNYLSFMASSIVPMLKESKEYDVIFSPSTPPIFGPLVCLLCGKIFRKPVVYNIQDLYPEILDYQRIIKNKWVLKVLMKASVLICRSVRKIVVISENMQKTVVKTRGVRLENVQVIPNFHDTEVIKPKSRENSFAKENKLIDRFGVLFAGNIGYSHGLEFVIETAAMVRDVHGIVFVILGRGDQKDEIERMAHNYGLSNVLFPPLQPYEKMGEVFASVDLGLVCLREGFGVASVPSKFFAIMASGTPVIAMVDADNDVAEIVQQEGVGTWVPPGDPEGLRNSILKYYRNRTLVRSEGKKGRALVEREYSFSATYQKYLSVLKAASLSPCEE